MLGAGKAVLEEDDGASGSVKIVFVQITWRHFKMQLFDNKYGTFLEVAWYHQIEAAARANVPQRCREQGFACAVICRKPLRGVVYVLIPNKNLATAHIISEFT